ncbi:MAG: ATP-dependent Clp protease ATP-binding subunit ClpC, partial [Clostridia bacterium]|nr:ATP-dependent Clp protease ATP-binding subunit ClpC [Clostridia bacterium]
MSDMTKRFSEGARRVISAALLAAKDMGHSYIGSEHLLLGILKEDCTSARLLYERGVEQAVIKKKIIGIVGTGCKSLLSTDDMTPICRRVILRASAIAAGGGALRVDTEHLLLSMLREECVAVRLLRECAVDIDELGELLDEL